MNNQDLIPIEGNIVHVDDTYSVMVIKFKDVYDCYGMKHTSMGETPFMYMFGCPCDITSFHDAVQMAIVNVPCYDDLFDDDE